MLRIPIQHLRNHMVVAEDIVTPDKRLLLKKGQALTEPMIQKLILFKMREALIETSSCPNPERFITVGEEVYDPDIETAVSAQFVGIELDTWGQGLFDLTRKHRQEIKAEDQ